MKNKLLPVLAITLISFTSCIQTRYMTEKYIKTEIEKHDKAQFSSIKTIALLQVQIKPSSQNKGGFGYLEFTGCKYNLEKWLVLGTKVTYQDPKKIANLDITKEHTEFIKLSLEDCNNIINNYESLLYNAKMGRYTKNEEVYNDFTITNDLFLSFRKSKQRPLLDLVDIWVKGEKFSYPTKKFINKINAFIKY